MLNKSMSDAIWPEKYHPGTTDNYVLSEVIAKDLSTRKVCPFLNNTIADLLQYRI
jgi:hypothetical protein